MTASRILLWGILFFWLLAITEPGRQEGQLSEKLGGWYLQGYEKDGHYFVGDNHKPGHGGVTVYTEVSKADWEKLKYYQGLGWKTNIAAAATLVLVFIFYRQLGLKDPFRYFRK